MFFVDTAASNLGDKSFVSIDMYGFELEENDEAVVVDAGEELLRFFLCRGDRGERGVLLKLDNISCRSSWIDFSKNCFVSEFVFSIWEEILCMSALWWSLFCLMMFSFVF